MTQTKPMLARKKPVTIEYMIFDGTHESCVCITNWMHENGGNGSYRLADARDGWVLYVKTMEGDMLARLGWHIIRGVAGEFYPCAPDIFEATYESLA